MLTRLKVSGFKNLMNVDLHFGPFTCVAGANGTGKSNLFDAITFLSALADKPLVEAAMSVRSGKGQTTDIRTLFHHVEDRFDREMSFEVEMIVPAQGVDDLGQEAKASITFLRYILKLAYREGKDVSHQGTLEILREELTHINKGDARKHLFFPHKPTWRNSAITGGGRRGSPFISTEQEGQTRIIKRHQDGTSGRPLRLSAADLPRTVLSVTNAIESPTALLARREMQSWRLLQLEPSSLRKPSEFTAPKRLGTDGSYLAATLYRLAHSKPDDATFREQIYGQVAHRLSDLIEDIRELWVERDDQRRLWTLYVTDMAKTPHPAYALSDGTLRFLALTVLELDPEEQGVLCLEEPENGIHPGRIQAMLELLQDIATDVEEPIGADNPLRQVIINTHSPSVVSEVPHDSLLVVETKEMIQDNQRLKRANFSYLTDTWRQKSSEKQNTMPLGQLLAYLNPVMQNEKTANSKRVIDRKDARQLLLPLGER